MKYLIANLQFLLFILFCFHLMVVLMTELLIQPKAVDFAFNMTNLTEKNSGVWSL